MKIFGKTPVFWLLNGLASVVVFVYMFNYEEFVLMRGAYLTFLAGMLFLILLANILTYRVYSKPKYKYELGPFFVIWFSSIVLMYLLAFHMLFPTDYNIR